MTQAQSAAFIQAQTTLMQCRMNGMLAENDFRARNGNSVAYGEESFASLEADFEPVIGYNACIQLFNNCID